MTARFFELLYGDERFCKALGRVILSAGMLETYLRLYIESQDIGLSNKKATLGALVSLLKRHGLLSRNGQMHFDDLTLKRNYLAHNLYDLFSNQIEESILPREGLVDEDLDLFEERADQFAEDLRHFVKIVQRKISEEGEEGLSSKQLL